MANYNKLNSNKHVHISCIYVKVKTLPPVLYEKYSTRREAKMSNITQGNANIT